MIAHVAALKALLAPLGYPVHFTEAPAAPTMPYVLLWTSGGSPSLEASIVGETSTHDSSLGVTVVAGTPDGVLIVQERVRATLTPLGVGTLTVPGRLAWLRLMDSRPVAVDPAVTITATGKHPAYGVDMYRLVSTPA